MEDNTQVLNEITSPNHVDSQTEKLLSQSEVNKIVQREKQNAALRAKQQAEEDYMRKLEDIKSQSAAQQQHNGTTSREVDADRLYQQVQERFNQEMQQKQLQQEMSTVANNYIAKMSQGKAAYEDFDEITKEFDPSAFPKLVYLVSGIDNAADIIYDLSRNPSKLVTLDTLAERSPKLAQAELLKLSRSIAENQTAKSDASQQSTAAPLDHLRPSRVSGATGEMSISDLRQQPWLRG